jgi:hypothetical protein
MCPMIGVAGASPAMTEPASRQRVARIERSEIRVAPIALKKRNYHSISTAGWPFNGFKFGLYQSTLVVASIPSEVLTNCSK